MKNVKRLVSMLAVLALAVCMIAGCSSGSSSESSSESTEAGGTTAEEDSNTEETKSEEKEAEEETEEVTKASQDYKIAVIQQHQTNAFQAAVTEGAETTGKDLGVSVTCLSADSDAATQISQIEQCVSEGYDAILFEPVDPDGLTEAAQDAADAGVVVINIVSACTDWEDNGISAICLGDNVSVGETEMQNVADLIDGKGDIAILTGPSGDSGGLARHEGYENILKDYPDINIVVEADCGWDTADAQSTAESWLTAYDLAAIVSENDGMAVGAGNAAGADSGIIISGVDGDTDGLEAIKDGRITGTISQDGGNMVSDGIKAAVTILDGGTLSETEIITPGVWVDADNVDEFE